MKREGLGLRERRIGLGAAGVSMEWDLCDVIGRKV